jgi:lactoylglutathione lyase
MNAIRIEHVAIWVRDLERMREFYVAMLGATSGEHYENRRTGFQSYFLSFGAGARLELMSRAASKVEGHSQPPTFGYAHIALRLGTRENVNETVARLEGQGIVVLSRPRVTGDGYFEAVIEDPEGNRIELVE